MTERELFRRGVEGADEPVVVTAYTPGVHTRYITLWAGTPDVGPGHYPGDYTRHRHRTTRAGRYRRAPASTVPVPLAIPTLCATPGGKPWVRSPPPLPRQAGMPAPFAHPWKDYNVIETSGDDKAADPAVSGMVGAIFSVLEQVLPTLRPAVLAEIGGVPTAEAREAAGILREFAMEIGEVAELMEAKAKEEQPGPS